MDKKTIKKPIKKIAKKLHKKKPGRKNKYETHVKPKLRKIQGWIDEGIIEAEICNRLGISVASWENYKNQYVVLLERIKRGHAKVNNDAVHHLIKRFRGYGYEETVTEQSFNEKGKVISITDRNGNSVSRTVKVTKKQIAPDVTALIFWLKNKLPEDYKDRRELDLSSPDGSGLKVIIIKPEDIKE